MRILLVDDDPDIRLIGAMALEKIGGHAVEAVESGGDALAALEQSLPDLVLSDSIMPGMSGSELCGRLKEDGRYRDVPVIFLTADARPAEIARLRELGAAGVIAKPFDPMTLADEVERLLTSCHPR